MRYEHVGARTAVVRASTESKIPQATAMVNQSSEGFSAVRQQQRQKSAPSAERKSGSAASGEQLTGTTVSSFYAYSPYPTCFLRPSVLSLFVVRNSGPGSHSRLSCPPPHYRSCLHYYREKTFRLFFPRRREDFQPFLPSSTCVKYIS